MKGKIIAAYLKGFSKKNENDIFLFEISFFCFRDIDVLLLCKLGK